jgi:hypothetical protein
MQAYCFSQALSSIGDLEKTTASLLWRLRMDKIGYKRTIANVLDFVAC